MTGEYHPEIDVLRNWLLTNSPKVSSVGDDDDLIESRVLDSFALIRFIYFVEEVFGREVVLDESIAQNFRTLAAVCRYFKVGGRTLETHHA